MKKLVILTALFLSFSAFSAEFSWDWERVTAADIKQKIAAGANVNAPDDNDFMPLHSASFHSNINVVNALIAAGANVNAKVKARFNSDGRTPLHIAVFSKTPDYLDIIKALIAAGADVNAKINASGSVYNGQTPLRHFVWNYFDDDWQSHLDPVKIAKTLIAAGADPKIKDMTGLPLVINNNFPEMNKVLINSGALVKDGLVLEPTLTKNTNTNTNTNTNAYATDFYCSGRPYNSNKEYFSAVFADEISESSSDYNDEFRDFVKQEYGVTLDDDILCSARGELMMSTNITILKNEDFKTEVIKTGWKPAPFTTQAISDFHITVPSNNRKVEICVRDYECEDGDEVRVSVNYSTIIDDEIDNSWQCETVKVDKGKNKIELYAINGSGRKGSCSYHDANTGEIRIKANNTQTQRWEHRGGKGSSSNIIVDIE